MPLGAIVLIAIGMAMDCTAVSLGVASGGYANSPRPIFRLAFHFGLFQALMPILGWLVGLSVADLVSGTDHWIAFGLLGFVGVRMIRSGLNPHPEIAPPNP